MSASERRRSSGGVRAPGHLPRDATPPELAARRARRRRAVPRRRRRHRRRRARKPRRAATELKQFRWVAGKPMLLHSVQTFQRARTSRWSSCVLPKAFVGDPPPWLFQCDIDRLLVSVGGRERTESVANGLEDLPEEVSVVLVHDAARPLVTDAMIDRVIAEARSGHGAVRGAAGRRHAQGGRRRRAHRAHGRARAALARADAAGLSARDDRARARRRRAPSTWPRPTTPRCASGSGCRSSSCAEASAR